MEQKRNLCAMIPVDLHEKVIAEKRKLGQKTVADCVEHMIRVYFEGGIIMAENKTLAFQVSEDLFYRLKKHLEAESARTGRKISQKEFVIGLIEAALADAEQEENN
ncbi:MAG: 4-oxalocrotonate tautomerase [Oscillospiraceae bacterium]|nr:4-oxalocrotonate tautomerase [Oscillospiraceae bacterium]